MIYSFKCEACDIDLDVNLPIDRRNEPLENPCPSCGVEGKMIRVFEAPNVVYGGAGSVHDQAAKTAGKDWGDLVKGIQKGAGRQNTMEI